MTTRIFPRLYLAADSDVTGPHDPHEVLNTFRSGSLSWEHLASIEGTDDWQPVGDILRAFFPAVIATPAGDGHAAPSVAHAYSRLSPPRPSSLGRFLDMAGSSVMILGGASVIVIGIPLQTVLIGYALIPVGILMLILGTVMLFKS
jgi:hypothetical protein